ncbi:MAG: ROK family protein [Suipraeoptans sp.]
MSEDSILESRKNYQRNKMMNIIRSHKNISRNDVKKISAYSMTTVLSNVNEMIEDGFVIEEECDDSRVGRKPIWLKINPDGGYFIGVEFNRNRIHCVVLDFTGVVIHKQAIEIDSKSKNSKKILIFIKSIISGAFDFLEEKRDKVIGIGIGVPGYNDIKNGISISYNHIKGWENIPVKSIIEKEYHIPCYMDNNVNVMIYAYKWLIYNGHCEDMLFVSIRTGARVMPIINNQPVSSTCGFPGELGHVRIRGGSRLCACGRYGCLNSEISDVAIVNKILDGIRLGRFREINEQNKEITMQSFITSVLNGDADSIKLEKQIAKYLGETLGMLVNIFAPKHVVLYGDLMEIGELFLEDVRQWVDFSTIEENIRELNISASQFDRHLGAMGAASLVMQEAFPFAEEKM